MSRALRQFAPRMLAAAALTLAGAMPVQGDSAGSFQPAGHMAQGRFAAQATLLTDGTVLVTGGASWGPMDPSVPPNSAELFDPKTDQFTAVIPMLYYHDRHQAVRLLDGRVLVVGGGSLLQEAEMFDPVAHRFSPAGRMAVGRDGPTATLLPDGRVLVAGGASGLGGPTDTAELFDPVVPPPSSSSAGSTTAVAIPGPTPPGTSTTSTSPPSAAGCVPSADAAASPGCAGPTPGGPGTPFTPPPPSPPTANFQPAGKMTTPRAYHSAVALPDGRVVILGGFDANGRALASVEIYDPQIGQFSSGGRLVEARTDMGVALLPGNRILVVGGSYDTSPHMIDGARRSIEIYDPATGQSAIAGALADARAFFILAPLPDGRLLAAGGYNGPGDPRPGDPPNRSLRSAEIVDPRTGTSSPAASPTTERFHAAGIALPDGRVLILGGLADDPARVWAALSLKSAEVYLPAGMPGAGTP